MAVRRMDIFGDDSTEDVDSDDIFYHSSAEKSKIFNAERSESEDAHHSNPRRSSGLRELQARKMWSVFMIMMVAISSQEIHTKKFQTNTKNPVEKSLSDHEIK